MSGGLMGSVVGVVLGVAGGAIGAYVGCRRSSGPRERDAVARMVVVIVGAAVLALIAGLYAPPVHRVIAFILLAVIAFVLNRHCASAGQAGGEKGAGKAETRGQ
jgi:uncharacterized membrane protein YeaQ/YmgE (transglycosylase-associated protein family)